MVGCNPIVTPIVANAKLGKEAKEELADTTVFKQVVGSLRYLCNTRPDLYYSVGVIKLKQGDEDLVGYSYPDWCGDKSDKRSTSYYVFKFMKSSIAWSLKKQPVKALSSCEVRYIVGSYAVFQAFMGRSIYGRIQD
ncbi:secreted RxLR effector protein 161-like [Cicer arietinum]|uniref:secreted RxLR effector protein 161-like n=1 Tax=Cicer arietinum TaxID=3827 RepID=UPI00032AAFC3